MRGLTKVTTRHHGRAVEWTVSKTSIVAIVDGQIVSIRKLHPSLYRPSADNRRAKPADAPRYRAHCNASFVQPGWGFRRSLKEAKDDGVAAAIAAARHVADARLRSASRKTQA